MTDNEFFIIEEQNHKNARKDPAGGTPPPSSEPPMSAHASWDKVLHIFKSAATRNVSDIHFQVGSLPIFRVDGTLSAFSQAKPVTDALMSACVEVLLNRKQQEYLETNRQVDCSITIPDTPCRFRINFFYQRNHLSAALRLNPLNPPTMELLGLPPMMERLTALPHGLVLLTGGTGCGKTTTMAALINHMNNFKNAHIITLSEPIEYIHKNKTCLISQREIGDDATSFASALRVALREDPDVLVVEEMRDLESISMALTAAETGHLVFATLHTNDSVQAVDRLVDVFPPNQQAQIRFQLAMTLQAVVSQVLLKRKSSPGRVAIFETMPVTIPIRNMIRENQTIQIYNFMSMNRNQGFLGRNDALREAVDRGVVSQEEANSYFLDLSIF
ncbi:MAG: PilT/PilU family type 4a pilus ATPase [Candidatus Omnitrophota bacterium]